MNLSGSSSELSIDPTTEINPCSIIIVIQSVLINDIDSIRASMQTDATSNEPFFAAITNEE